MHAGAVRSFPSGQDHPITTGRYTVILGLLTIERRRSTLRPVMAVFALGSEELSEVEVVLTRLGSNVSRICEGIASIGDSQDVLGGRHVRSDRCLSSLRFRSFSIAVTIRLP